MSKQSIPSLRRLLQHSQMGVSGTAAIEFGLISAILILMSIGVVDIGMGFYRNMQVQNAAQAGATYAMKYGFAATPITNAVKAATSYSDVQVSPAPSQFCGCPSNAGISTVSCTTTCSDGLQAPTYVSVSAQATYTPIIAYPLIPQTFTLVGKSTVRIQ